jgi:hypothetical protein
MLSSGSWRSRMTWPFTGCPHCDRPSAARLFLPPMTKRESLAICPTTGWLSHVRTCHVGGPRRWPACAARLAVALGGGGEPGLHRLPAPSQAFDCTTLHAADNERRRHASCQTMGCLSHVRTCHVGGPRRWPACAVGLAAALRGGGEPGLHRVLAPSQALDCTTLHAADNERGRLAIYRTIGWLSHVCTCHVGGLRCWPACTARVVMFGAGSW